ncbi:ORF6N domain-containing protein [Candidatus Peregrinibacteria bacterium]|nr:ORF6N domain-containing protein [Candidatus Peregrinibacteria bacterium]
MPKSLLPAERIERSILLIRGQKVIIDADLAALYGVSTKRFNEQVKRNKSRFPADFVFRLSPREKANVVANCDHLQKLKFSPGLPYAFTEHGALMAAGVLNTPAAIGVSIAVVRTFVRLRKLLASHADLAQKLDELEAKYDEPFKIVFDAIRQLMIPPVPSRRKKIGFRLE